MQRRAFGLEARKYRLDGRQRQRMPDKRAGKKRHADFGHAVVAKRPLAAIQRVHEGGFASQHANRHSPAQHLAVCRQVGADAKQGLRAAWMCTETGDNFVKHQRRAGSSGDLAQLLEKSDGLEIRPPALHRLADNGGDFLGVRLDPRQRLGRAVVQHHHVPHALARNARSDGRGDGAAVARAACLDQYLVEHAMIVSSKGHDLVAAGHRARQAHRRHHGLRAGIAKRHALVACHFTEQLGDLASEQRLRTNLKSLAKLLLEGALNKVGPVAKHDRAEAIQEVNIFVTVEVPELGTL